MNEDLRRILLYSISAVVILAAFLKSPYYNPEKISDFYVKMGIWENDNLRFYDAARLNYKIALFFNPKSAWAYNAIGNTYYNQTSFYYANISEELTRRGYEKAILNFTKAISLAYNYTAAYTNRGDCHRFLFEYEDAIKDYETAIKYDSKNKRGLYGLALVYESQKQYDKSNEFLKKLIAFYPEYEDAYFGLGWNYDHLGDYKSSVENYEKLVELNPQRIDAWINLSYVSELGLKDYEKALYYAEKALELNPYSLYALSNKAYALVCLKQYDEAMVYIQKQLDLDANHSRAYFQRGQVKLAKNDKSSAKEDFEHALELEKQSTFDDSEKIIEMIQNFLKQCE